MSDQAVHPQALSFTAFVLSLASTAAIHFGDLPDPISGECAPLNLDGAAQMIEILALLDQKTRGNLTAEERQVLEQVLYELRLRFVEASRGGTRIVEP
jgi:GAF domain-containing protein